MGAGDHDVGAEMQRVVREVGMEAEVGGPGGIDDERHTVLVGRVSEPGDVADRADVGRVAHDHRPGPRAGGERPAYGVGRHAPRQAGRLVDLGPHPDRREPGEHEAQQHRPVQRAADDHLVTLAAQGQGDGLVGMGGAAGREAAHVGTPQGRGAGLGVGKHAGRELHRVEPGIERDVAGDHVADQVGALLVAGDGERRGRGLLEAQPGVQQGRVVAQAARVSGHRASTPPGRR